MQADTAVEPSIAHETYPFSAIQGDANILICPDLESANIAYKLVWRLGKVEVIGPILAGVNAAVHVRSCSASCSRCLTAAGSTLYLVQE
jgi:malate dehydrogenase (oxaloacetate-decarboxylating)(NADP+)